ncbi:putative membrane protein [Vibrio paracholerae 87395]|nr:putative membrane protein [Vibrio paracholerae 87395]
MVAVIFTVGGFFGALLAPILFDIDTSAVTNHLDAKDIMNSLVAAIIFAVLTWCLKKLTASFNREG